MPFVYCFHSRQEAENFTTSATPNMEIDAALINVPTLPSRVCRLQAVYTQGKTVGLTALSSLSFRLKRWATTSSGGSSITLSPVDLRAPLPTSAVQVGVGGGTAAVASGTGGPTIVGGFGSLASEPGGWIAADIDSCPRADLATTKSIDLFSISGTPLLNYEFSGEILEL